MMLIDGNDSRGIDVGILSTDEYPVLDISSHVDGGPFSNRVFSCDCPECHLTFPDDSGLARRLPLAAWLVPNLLFRWSTSASSGWPGRCPAWNIQNAKRFQQEATIRQRRIPGHPDVCRVWKTDRRRIMSTRNGCDPDSATSRRRWNRLSLQPVLVRQGCQ
ncbi:hypothetical protein ACFRAQ_13880 [Nocardia sp. NPDC056611]|uniref:hypothetical protein n=1 Tax=Nocardia sp. NPDC056611 TaxID=3345877 RepID=UPI00366D727D